MMLDGPHQRTIACVALSAALLTAGGCGGGAEEGANGDASSAREFGRDAMSAAVEYRTFPVEFAFVGSGGARACEVRVTVPSDQWSLEIIRATEGLGDVTIYADLRAPQADESDSDEGDAADGGESSEEAPPPVELIATYETLERIGSAELRMRIIHDPEADRMKPHELVVRLP